MNHAREVKILVTDDEPVIRMGLSKLIEQSGVLNCEIRHAGDGEEALRLMKNWTPDLLFTDIRMPVMDGLELCRRLSERQSGTQIVVVSGYSDFEYARACVDYGVKRYLLKPVNRKELGELLEKLKTGIRADHSSSSAALLSIKELDAWAKRLELAVWELREGDVEAILEEWENHYPGYALTLQAAKELFHALGTTICGKLEARGAGLSELQPDYGYCETTEQSGKVFADGVRRLLHELRQKRLGSRKLLVEEAKAYIERHLDRDVSLEEVAERLGLNASYFSQLFKLKTEETFVQYRIRRKMELAKRLLEKPHYRITDISYEVGYADHPHFTKTFKKVVGCTPSEYRQKLGIE
ncbi:response regulator transcription factor [Paenibacillus sp. DMB20]|uniref:response regulator transcription factor n=1 Tax=Paenibacillus sp. DMB20 TaxID=1642570 RepID=UPI00062797D0|nr:response regulator [Paenibacillus sp. DMB20]KKO55208.1 AraC family transcriptional regulator [Paenibacillus sp. DMB20]